jgi:hypothetical protein
MKDAEIHGEEHSCSNADADADADAVAVEKLLPTISQGIHAAFIAKSST